MSRKYVITTVLIGTFLILTAISSAQQSVPVLYPKDYSLVGNKVNVVLNPAGVPFFRVTVGKKEYPVVDTSTGAHALQGVELEQGANTLMVAVLDQSGDQKDKNKFKVLSWRAIRVFNSDGVFSPVPEGFHREPFHTREHETTCSSCHKLETKEEDFSHEKPENVLCYTCHRMIPAGRNIHGPAAVWNCLACHDPDLYPARYSFSSSDPWKGTKTTRSVELTVFTVPTADLFKPASDLFVSKAKAKNALKDVVEYCRQNPSENIRLEVRSDDWPIKKQKTKKGKSAGIEDNKTLSAARAKALATLLGEADISPKRIVSAGMDDTIPMAPNTAKKGLELNNRAEIVVYPPVLNVTNGRQQLSLKDLEQVSVTITYDRGPAVRQVRIVEKNPEGVQYVGGSAMLNGRALEPNRSGNSLVWNVSDRDSNFSESLTYLVKKSPGAAVSGVFSVSFSSGGRDQSRVFDPQAPKKTPSPVKDACLKCHAIVLSGTFKHGPASEGYCTLCHDPHASPNPAWLRKPAWDLCTTCHQDKGSGVHVLAGYMRGSHPTRDVPDPLRPGKNLTCTSCHNPHSAENSQLISFTVRSRTELCNICHKK